MGKLYDVLTEQEQDTLRKLQAKAKRVQRQDKAFWQWVDDHADEIKDRLGVRESGQGQTDWFNEYQKADAKRKELQEDIDKLQNLADLYGCTLQELFDWIRHDQQVSYYKRHKSNVSKVYPSID